MATALKHLTTDEFLLWAEGAKAVGNCLTASR